MARIPIYDAGAPITCTIGDDEVAGRVELIERLRASLRRVERTEHGLLLRFPDRPDVDADLRRFAVDEKRCCRFWGFAVDRSGGDLTFRWDAPPDARDLLARIEDVLTGEAPVGDIRGFL